MKTRILILTFFVTSLSLQAQLDAYDQMKAEYDSLRNEKNYEEALVTTKQMNAWALENETDTSLRYAVSLRYVGNVKYSMRTKDSALYYWELSKTTLEAQNREMHSDYASSLNNLGLLYKNIGNYKAAEPLLKHALEIRRKTLGEEHSSVASSLMSLGGVYYEMSDYKSAEPYLKQALEIRKKALGEDHPSYASSVNNLADLYCHMGDYKAAEPLLRQSLEIKKKTLGEDHAGYASSLNNFGNMYADMGDYKSAEPYYKQSLDIYKKALGEDHSDVAMSLHNLGALYYDMGDYKAAEPLLRQSFEIHKKALGEEHPSYATSLNNLGNLYSRMGDYKAAESYYKLSLDIYKKALGEDHPDYASSLNNLGIMYSDMVDYKAAEPLLKHALEIRRKILGEDHPDYASSLMSLGGVYYEMSDYKSAEPYFKQALEIRKKALGEEHPSYATSLNDLGNLYSDMADYKAAEPLYKQALEIRKKAFGEEHPSYASSLNNLGALYHEMGDYKSTEPYYKQSLDIYKKILGEEHPDVAMSLNNLGALYYMMGDYKAAEPLYKQALEIRKKALGEEHPDYAASLNNLGILYTNMGDYKAAEPLYKQALEIRKKALGEEHPDYASSLNNLGILYTNMGDYKAAEPYYKLSFAVKIKNLSANFSWLSEKEKEVYWAKENKLYADPNEFAVKASVEVPSSTALSYNGSLVAKSLLLETSRELDKAIAQSSNEELIAQFNEMKQLRRVYSKMQSEGSDKKEIMERYKKQADSLDKILVNSLGEYAASKRKFEITWKDVQSGLKSNEAAIEFARYYDNEDSLHKYMALIVRPGYEYPKVVNLAEENEIKKVNAKYNPDRYYATIWQPLEQYLEGVETVYYSPTGELNNVPFHAIYSSKVLIEEKRYEYLMDKYELHQLTSTRYLADDAKIKTYDNTATLFGAINYEYAPTEKIETQQEYLFAILRGGKKHNLKTEKWSYLNWTNNEIDSIATSLNKDWNIDRYIGNMATEDVFYTLNETKSPRIVHIATHGFAFDHALRYDSTLTHFAYNKYSMARTGLIMAGGNWTWGGNDTLEHMGLQYDGVLTASEISNMDLSNTELAVLSACNTAKGQIQGNEGTFGLKRAFKLAGVEYILVSLWSVPDQETSELMSLFYKQIAKGFGVEQAFNTAQSQMRNDYSNRPNLWAGFVLVR